MIPVLTPMDWHLAIAAHLYERGKTPIMSDMTFDTLSKVAAERGCEIPGFQPFTGMWVRDMDRDLLETLYLAAKKHNGKYSDMHLPAVISALRENGIEYKRQFWETDSNEYVSKRS